MSEGLPDIAIEPGSILQLAIPSDPCYTIESPSEIREKLAELANDYSDGDESGLLTLSGLELHTRPEVSPEPYELLIHPKLIAFVKSVHPNYWKDQLRMAAEANEQWRQVEKGEEGAAIADVLPEPFRQMLGGMGVNIAGPGKGMSAEEFAEPGGPERECCCGHKAERHEVGEKIGPCEDCGCSRFHTHGT